MILSNEKNTLLKRVGPYTELKIELDEKNAILVKIIAEKKRMDSNLQFGLKVTTNQVQLRDFYNDMGAAMPKSTWLYSAEYRSNNSVEVVGYAISDESILNYIAALSKSNEVEDVTLNTMELKTFDNETVKERYEVKAFKLVAKLRPPGRENNTDIKGGE